MTAQPAEETIHDMEQPDPRTVEAAKRVINERNGYISDDGWLCVADGAGVNPLIRLPWVTVAKLYLDKCIVWSDERKCYVKAEVR